MAQVTGWLAMSHGPQLMVKPDQWNILHDRHRNLALRPELERETIEVKRAKWDRCMKAIEVLRRKLATLAPDVLVILADDQHENLLDDVMPPFTIYVGEEAEASISLSYFNEPRSANKTKYKTHAALAQQLVESLMESGFDPAYSRELRYEGGLGHAFARVLKFLTPDASLPVIPVMVNTYYPPAPSATRCVAFGHALAEALKQSPQRCKIAIIASGGLSHTIIDENLDHGLLDAMKGNDLAYLAAVPASNLVAGTSEIRNWIAAAAAANRPATVVDYVPCYRMATGVGCGMGFAYWE